MAAKKKSPITFTLYEGFLPLSLSKSQRRRLEIIEAAIKLYASIGIDHVTYELLAKAAGASRGLIQHYYPDLEGLTLESMKYIRARLQQYAVDELANKATPTEKMEAYVNAVFTWAKKYPYDARVWILFLHYCSFRESFRKLNSTLVEQGFKRICALIELGNHDGQFNAKDVPLTAKLIQININGGFLEIMSERRTPGSPDVHRATVIHCLTLARGEAKLQL